MTHISPARLRAHLKQITYGGNDGIVTTFAIVAGFAGAAAEGAGEIGALAVLVFGLANLFADGVSMGLGELLSSRSQRALYRAERARAEGAGPAALAAALTARGMAPDDARAAAPLLATSPALAADLLTGATLPDMRHARPALDGLITFAAFLAFGLIPLLPYLVAGPENGSLATSSAATFAALIALGALRVLATGEPPARAIGEVVGLGGICAAVAYLVGAMVG